MTSGASFSQQMFHYTMEVTVIFLVALGTATLKPVCIRASGRTSFGDSVTTDHISPVGRFLGDNGVAQSDFSSFDIPLVVRIDTPVEIDYYRAGGILPYVLAQILRANA
ncbi:MAG: hypothetical protein NTV80_00840 [Verrucomicrobia bacterium]|nr:hypothetical protein [Verrucomicrobiota bacterium]